MFLHGVEWILGVYPIPAGTSAAYQFWSGIAPGVAIVGTPIALWHKHSCHSKGCLYLGRHIVDGTPYCNRHHELARRVYNGVVPQSKEANNG